MTNNVAEEKLAISESSENPEIAARLRVEIVDSFGPRDEKPLALTLHNGSGAVVAGLNGVSHWRWLYVRHLWVDEGRRGHGLGRRLMDKAEAVAHERDCVGVYIDTFEPRVASFYESLGFSRAGEIADFPPGARRVFLSKRLDAAR